MAVDGDRCRQRSRHTHVAVGIHAEGADLVAVLLCAVDELGLVNNVGDVLKHGRRKLDAHADIDLVVYKLHASSLRHCSENHSAPLLPGATMR